MMPSDFQQPIAGDGFQIFFPFEGRGPHIVTPDRLQVAMRDGRRPDFLLQFYRGQNPMMRPQPYGVLDLRLEPHYPLELAVAQLRDRYPRAQLEPATFGGGYLRLYALGGVDLPSELRQPAPLAWNGLTIARFLLRLSFEGAQFLKGLLQNEALPLFAQAELELVGIAPRLPVRVRFDPARLRSALLAMGDGTGRVARDELVSVFAGDPAGLGLELEGETDHLDELAEALADWVRARFATFVAAPSVDGRCYWLLNPPALGAGRAEWDLSQPLETWRPIVLSLRPLEVAREAIQSHGIEAIVPPSVVVPPLSTGMHQIEVAANIPEVRPGIPALGVRLRAAPRPPFRPQAVEQSVELVPPADIATIRLQLSPAEHLDYVYSTFVVLENSRGIRLLNGRESEGTGDRLLLTPDDFPVLFVPVAAESTLVDLATVRVVCRWFEAGVATSATFDLDRDRPALAVPIPRQASEATIEFEARARQGGRILQFGPVPARPLLLGFHVFPEYGPHQVTVELPASATEPLVAIDLLPEDQPETVEAMTVLALTPRHPRKTWTYLASSPFQAGYRFRRHAGIDGNSGPWSDVRLPFEDLVIDPERL